MPLWTIATVLSESECGWELFFEISPCVAHLVWPIPMFPLNLLSFILFANLSILDLCSPNFEMLIFPILSMTAIPAES